MSDRPRNYYNEDPSGSRYNRANYGSAPSRGSRSGWEEPAYRGGADSAPRGHRSGSHRVQVPNAERDFDRQLDRANREATRRSRAQSAGRATRSAYAGDSCSASMPDSQRASRQRSAGYERPARDQRPTRADRASYAAHEGRPNRDQRPARNRNDAPAKQRKSGGFAKRIIIALFALLLVIAGGIALYVNVISGNLHRGVDDGVRDVLVKTDYSKEPFYMLLLGTDESSERNADTVEDYGGSFRSDSMMLARIDCPNKRVTLISLERDTLVDMGEHGWEKLNAASAWGGPAYAIEMVSKMAHNVPISHFALIDFDGFCSVVDALGGIDVDVPIEINDDDAGGYLAAGPQTLNGQQALILCRSRNAYENYGSGNSYRSANQRLVLSAIAHKVLQADIGTIASTVSALSGYMSTDLEMNDIIGLAQALRGLDMSTDMLTAMQPTTAKYEDGMWFNVSDEPEWATMIDRVNKGLSPTEGDIVDSTGTVMATAGSGEHLGGSSANVYLNAKSGLVLVRNGGAPEGSGSAAGYLLQKMGYDTDIANASSSDYTETLVVFSSPEKRQDALQIAQTLGVGKVLLNNGDYRIDGDFLVILGSNYSN